MDILGIGFAEIMFVLLIALMVFGPRRLPEIAAKAGKTVRDLRNMSNGLLAEWQREITVAARLEELENVKKEFDLAKEEITGVKQELTDVKTSVTDVTKTISPPKLAELEAVAMGKSNDETSQETNAAQSVIDTEQSQENEVSQSPVEDGDTSTVENTVTNQTSQITETSTAPSNGVASPLPKETPPVSPSEPEKLVND